MRTGSDTATRTAPGPASGAVPAPAPAPELRARDFWRAVAADLVATLVPWPR
ncbi:hypothetical protein [Phycicoccus flavus]|uniref:Uncharacterized protein n=1 Tax=Phycicoccus flavus TaxID=2502783 RepID=A0A8T6R058_9MICO|nr:hypothetical protein [Phycicoccus flavus]NHA66914.1 hypothetical protein [Phycicoccus flavus]